MTSIGDMVNIQSNPLSHEPHPEFMDNGYLGIEVEVEEFHALERLKYWHFTDDGSLRRNGGELVLKEPMRGRDVVSALEELRDTYGDKWGGIAAPSCSVHVHVDVRDFDADQFIALLGLSIMFEGALYNVTGKRDYNLFCLSQSHAPGTLLSAGRRLTGALFQGATEATSTLVEGLIASAGKYSGINMNAQNLGTVEYRHMEGTLDFDRILKWIKVLLCLSGTARQKPDLMSMFQDISCEGPEVLCHRIFGEHAEEMVYPEMHRDCMQNLRLVQVLLTLRNPSKFELGHNPEFFKKFGERGTAWAPLHEKAVSAVSTEMTQDNLSSIIDNMIALTHEETVKSNNPCAEVGIGEMPGWQRQIIQNQYERRNVVIDDYDDDMIDEEVE